jgi:sulfate/thiosulfate transport system substrate-binding protein
MDWLRVHSARAWLLFIIVLGVGCKGSTDSKLEPKDSTSERAASLTLGAYTTPREAYGTSILPAFRRLWRDRSGRDIELRESYLGSGAQARAIIGGFEADVAALSLEPDIEQIRKAGLIRHDWKDNAHGGIVTRSVVVIGVREGNPKNIRTWQDLARPGIEVLTPNVRTSGGAMWNVLAVYGAATRGHAGTPGGDGDAAVGLLASILRNVKIMDRGARESILTFERGIGDAIITYENEILVGRAQGKRYDYVAPSSTILIENPIALIDAYADRHGSREVAQAFLDFLWTPKAQRSFAQHGLRPVVESVAAEVQGQFVAVEDLFTIRDLGGWTEAQRLLFDQGGVYDQALARNREDSR